MNAALFTKSANSVLDSIFFGLELYRPQKSVVFFLPKDCLVSGAMHNCSFNFFISIFKKKNLIKFMKSRLTKNASQSALTLYVNRKSKNSRKRPYVSNVYSKVIGLEPTCPGPRALLFLTGRRSTISVVNLNSPWSQSLCLYISAKQPLS